MCEPMVRTGLHSVLKVFIPCFLKIERSRGICAGNGKTIFFVLFPAGFHTSSTGPGVRLPGGR